MGSLDGLWLDQEGTYLSVADEEVHNFHGDHELVGKVSESGGSITFTPVEGDCVTGTLSDGVITWSDGDTWTKQNNEGVKRRTVANEQKFEKQAG